MPIHNLIRRHAELIHAREHGLWQTLGASEMKEMFFKDLTQFAELKCNSNILARVQGLRHPRLWNAIVALLGDANNVASKGNWTLYWALSQAVHELLPFIRLGMHEPALTGVLMANIRCALRMNGGINDGEVIAVHIADHQALWNESHSGADFGLVIETVRGGITRYITTLFQAKRMRQRRTRIDLNQAQSLKDSHIGAYLFYNEFKLYGRDEFMPTVKLAEIAYAEAKQLDGVDAINLAHDFALTLGFGIPSRISAIGAEYESPEEAIEALFDVELEQQLNHVLVTVVGEDCIPVAEVVYRERKWRSLVQRAMQNRSKNRAPFDDGPPPAPPAPPGF